MLRSLLLVVAVAAAGRAADPPPEFALVPADVAGVVHVRLADLWNHPGMADYRALVRKAGDDAVAKLDGQFLPPPSTIDRLTAFLMMPPGGGEPKPVVVVRFNKPFDPAKVRAAYMSGAKPESVGGKEFFATGDGPVAVHFVDAQTLVLADRPELSAYLGRKPAAGGKLAEALTQAADKPLVVVVNVKAIPVPPDALKQIPPDFKPVLDADLAVVTLSLADGAALTARLQYAGPDEATAALVALKKGLKQLKPLIAQQRAELEKQLAGTTPAGGFRPWGELPLAVGALAGLGPLAQADELIDNPPLKRVGDALVAEVNIPAGYGGTTAVAAIGVGLLLPAVQKVREAAARAQSQNNLKQIALACFNYESANQTFPPASVTDKKTGKRLLSWRVTILPYLEQEALYKQFKLDEPWDSPANAALIPLMPKVYADPRGTAAEPGLTYYKAFVGGGNNRGGGHQGNIGAAWDWKMGRKIVDIRDGTSNTFLAGAFGPPVTWTKPEDFEYDPKAELPNLFTPPFNGLLVAMCDGSVRLINPSIDPKTLRALITADGGENVGGKDIP